RPYPPRPLRPARLQRLLLALLSPPGPRQPDASGSLQQQSPIFFLRYNLVHALQYRFRFTRDELDGEGQPETIGKERPRGPLLAFAVTRPVTSREMSIAVVPRGIDCRNRISSGERGRG